MRATVASLTAMALCVGYLVAATGPWLLGAVHDASGDWTVPLVVLIAITLAELLPGVPGGRATVRSAGAADGRRRSASSAPARPGCCSPTCCSARASSRSCSRRARASTSSSACAPGCSSRARSTCSTSSGVADRLHREGMVHHGHRAALRRRAATGSTLSELAGGRAITVYGQQEVVKDLIAARLDAGGELAASRSTDVRSHGLDVGPRRRSRFRTRTARSCAATSIAGCDGFHGVSPRGRPRRRAVGLRARVPVRLARDPGRARAPSLGGADLRPPRPRLRAAQHALARGHPALPPGRARRGHRRRGPTSAIWEELQTRLARPTTASRSTRARSSRRAITPMRSFVVEPMRYGRLFLAGDAAHIVPPTGAKGLNLAVADVRVLAAALRGAASRDGDAAGLRRLLGPLPAPGLARAALLVVDDPMLHRMDAATRSRRSCSARSSSTWCARRRGARRRWPRTTWDWSSRMLTAFDGVLARGASRRRSPTRRGCRRCSTPRRRWRARGAAGPSAERRRGDRRGVPRRALRHRRAGRRGGGERQPGRAARRARCASGPRRPRPPRRPPRAPRARTSSTPRRCSSAPPRAWRRCSTTCAPPRTRPARLAARAPRRRRWPGRTLLQQARADHVRPQGGGLGGAGSTRPAAALAARSRPAAQLGGAGRARSTALGTRPRCSARFAAELGLAEPRAAVAHRPQPDRRARRRRSGVACGRDREGRAATSCCSRRPRSARCARRRPGGSSSMPHKRNPVAAISARGLRPPGARAWSRTLLAAMEQEHERAAGAWHAEWAPLRAATARSARLAAQCLEG